MPETTSYLDSAALAVLAHPLRSRILSSLRREGPATATELAVELGTNSGATSYHLRKLAEVGLVRDTGQGEGRRREWESAAQTTSWSPSEFAADDDAQVALDWLEHTYFRQFVHKYESWLEQRPQWPAAWQDSAGASDQLLLLDAADLERLRDELWAVVSRYAAPPRGRSDVPPTDSDPDPADARVRVSWYLHVMPLEPTEPPPS